jgi:hypothetical protein
MLIKTASKVASEQAFWKFFEQNKVDFDGVACNPAAVSRDVFERTRLI